MSNIQTATDALPSLITSQRAAALGAMVELMSPERAVIQAEQETVALQEAVRKLKERKAAKQEEQEKEREREREKAFEK
jgi:hypothetical protein